jgi:hypothetical protein
LVPSSKNSIKVVFRYVILHCGVLVVILIISELRLRQVKFVTNPCISSVYGAMLVDDFIIDSFKAGTLDAEPGDLALEAHLAHGGENEIEEILRQVRIPPHAGLFVMGGAITKVTWVCPIVRSLGVDNID